MTNIGLSTIYGSILPTGNALRSVNLSKEAKHRLRIVDYYLSRIDVGLTCRHFGIGRSYLYKWLARFDPKDLSSLESKSCRPKSVRKASYDYGFVAVIRKLRVDYPSYSSKKLAVIALRDYGYSYSAATIGRVIKRFGLYFRAAVLRTKKRSLAARQAWKKRKPIGLKATVPRQVIEFDMKHIYIGGVKHYAFLAIDVFTKDVVIHLAGRPSSYQASLALKKVVDVFGEDITIVNDNGSENLKHAYDYLQEVGIVQFFARPHTPKDKPHVENVIGKLQQECLDENKAKCSLSERAEQITKWLNDYHFFRPHQALNYLTPAEFCATLNITIQRQIVSTM